MCRGQAELAAYRAARVAALETELAALGRSSQPTSQLAVSIFACVVPNTRISVSLPTVSADIWSRICVLKRTTEPARVRSRALSIVPKPETSLTTSLYIQIGICQIDTVTGGRSASPPYAVAVPSPPSPPPPPPPTEPAHYVRPRGGSVRRSPRTSENRANLSRKDPREETGKLSRKAPERFSLASRRDGVLPKMARLCGGGATFTRRPHATSPRWRARCASRSALAPRPEDTREKRDRVAPPHVFGEFGGSRVSRTSLEDFGRSAREREREREREGTVPLFRENSAEESSRSQREHRFGIPLVFENLRMCRMKTIESVLERLRRPARFVKTLDRPNRTGNVP